MAESLHILLGTSACLQWLCHSGERTVARGPLVLHCPTIFLGHRTLSFPIKFLGRLLPMVFHFQILSSHVP